jgi:hypothetical protein
MPAAPGLADRGSFYRSMRELGGSPWAPVARGGCYRDGRLPNDGSRELQRTRSRRRRCRGWSRIDTCELQRTLGERSAAPGIVKKIPGASTDAKEASTVPEIVKTWCPSGSTDALESRRRRRALSRRFRELQRTRRRRRRCRICRESRS